VKVLDYIARRKKEIGAMLETDKAIGADPYDNVARLKEVEKIEKIIRKGVIVMQFCPDCGGQLIHAEGCAMCPCCGWNACQCVLCIG